jgi:D-alanyl-D-alanine carboxypeptidase
MLISSKEGTLRMTTQSQGQNRHRAEARRFLEGSLSRFAGVAVLIFVTALAVVATSLAASAPPKITLPTRPMNAEDAAFVKARAELAMILGGADMPGLLLGVWDPQKGVYRGAFGVADSLSGRAPVSADAFRAGSVTKTFTATLILQLVAEGKLRLNGRVSGYAPKLAKRHPEIGQRTLRQLLSMRSGLPEYTDALVGIAPARGWTPDKVWSPNQLIDFGFRSGPVTAAGAPSATYVNTNYIILGEVATAVTGKTLPALVRERILRPLGLERTIYPRLVDASLPSRSTHGYVTAGGVADFAKYGSTVAPGTDVSDWSPSWGGSAGIMVSTLDDLARWAAARFGSALLPAKLRAERTQTAAPFPPYGPAARYGLGLLLLGQWEGHFGGIPGWTTMAFRNTKTGAIVVASVNACCGSQTSVLYSTLNRLYPGTLGS